ncbi:TPA: hypothetical protein QDB15_006199 [Burkholderia vietnamiensis]|uniref:hypothetical protein n=1 Tax=Burkholderia vietnamiensis TaxID=60552 RepID=UPI000B1E9822|nr:hypothetical protein [Burkholderia vietnamiensis]MCA8211866.1 hypothetical protein [Burkholderia vietnamiensis]HDR9103043.1 hypothetical protein [Burkholderia vietnamiensis]HDR9122319.1 hypothetical protein [Burkholderia vietnamiensis]HDR9172524.1 hypothetical protein [Burkholderia vietnamiensis]HDR9280412.1 hypothetical protein [Burkholderia vietnamiensis]
MGAKKISDALLDLFSTMSVFNEQTAVDAISPRMQEIVDANLKVESDRIRERYPTYEALLEYAAQLSTLQDAFLKAGPKTIEDFLLDITRNFADGLTSMGLNEGASEEEIVKVFGPKTVEIIQSRAKNNFQELNALLASSVKTEAKMSAVRHGADGGRKRADKFAPLKDRAFALARGGNFTSAHHAATQIAALILSMPEAKAVGLSSTSAVQTIGNWIRKEGIQFPSRRNIG